MARLTAFPIAIVLTISPCSVIGCGHDADLDRNPPGPQIDDDDHGGQDDDDGQPDDDDDSQPDDDDADDDTEHGDDDDDDDDGPYCYSEPIDPGEALHDLEAAFNGNNWLDTILETTDRRYPSGHDLLFLMQDDPYLSWFVNTSSFAMLMESLMTVVHEETHGYDYEYAQWGVTFAYWIRSDWQPSVHHHEGFERSEIYSMIENDSTDLYADTYLTGTQGTYDFMELLDEFNCYINGLAGIALVGEYEPWGISARDGALAFAYYLELYLRRARNVYPDFYASIQADDHLIDLVLIQWLRLHYFLDVSYAFPNLGVNDHAIDDLVHDTANQSEIEQLVGRSLQASPCLLAGDPYQPPY